VSTAIIPSAAELAAALASEVTESSIRSLDEIPTPALLLDVNAAAANVRLMAERADAAGVQLRPHAKCHRSAALARVQVAAGAVGQTCASVAEVEALALALGPVTEFSLLLATPTAGDVTARRIWRAAEGLPVIVAIDHIDRVSELVAACPDRGRRLGAVIDVDVVDTRTGVTSVVSALGIADEIANTDSIELLGVQGYAGALQHVPGRSTRRDATTRATDRLREVVEALRSAGHDVTIVTGGGTGTSGIDLQIGLLTELQPGSYLFMDRSYRDALGEDPEGQFIQSLTILSSVISSNQTSHVTIDAGLKSMATDSGPAEVLGHPGATYAFAGDEMGFVRDASLRRGDRVRLIPPHCDPTVDRYGMFWAVRGDEVLGTIPVTVRARA
jgi:D-serine deaminase-like pyridoxal phosphate-dependent protein